MVEIMHRKPYAVFRVFDREGRPIGEVVQPKFEPVVGRGARTVLLLRREEAGYRCGPPRDGNGLLPTQNLLLRI
jgi:hypothetical protein